MTTKAFTTVTVRLLGLLALLKGVLAAPVLLWALLQLVRGMKAGTPTMGRMPVLNLAFSIAVPVLVGFVCLVRTRQLVGLLLQGTDEAPAPTTGRE